MCEEEVWDGGEEVGRDILQQLALIINTARHYKDQLSEREKTLVYSFVHGYAPTGTIANAVVLSLTPCVGVGDLRILTPVITPNREWAANDCIGEARLGDILFATTL